jgi:ribonuclease G
MSKELVVSSTRHETRVALLEDDQVVELYYQREKEYSLAGSIHKGRVTRVLPGMQSAFVDIGLDRDAFLYVSDFFEDNDEYDKVVSSVEDKVLKLEKGNGVAPPPVSASTATEPGTSPPVTAGDAASQIAGSPLAEPALEVRIEPANARSEPRLDARGDNRGDRRGHRSRRRRQRGGRGGIPESKYFSPHARPEAPPADVAESGAGEEDEFPVLPGESLAKYGAAEGKSDSGSDEPVLETSDESDVEPSSGEPHDTQPSRELDVVEDVRTIEPVASAGEEPEPEPYMPYAPQASEVEDRPLPLASTTEEPVRESDTIATDAEKQADAASESTGVASNGQPVPAEAQPSPADGVEPARLPTSLTATLREQGPRYLHRMSRRMRRKMRAANAMPGEEQRPANGPQEIRSPEVRVDSKLEAARPDKSGPPSISDLLREGQEIIVQIAKEPLGQKGARITSHIALPGRFLVYMPTVDHVGISRKIPSEEERSRLKRVIQANRTGMPGGFIVRTAGDGRSEEELRADMLFLYNMWLDMRQKAEKKRAPALIHHDLDLVERILRDQLTSAFKTVWVDNEEVYENVLGFVQRFQPALVNRIKLYTRSTPIFDEFNITSELEKALRPKVWLKSGGYIVINQTEALVAIDINTGKYVGKSNRLEDTIVKTNTDAVREIVRQIRLRDLGGIIVVDFIDMDERKNRQKVMQALEDAMRADRAPYKILQFNDFGLVAITRKRVKQSLERTLCSPCPYCEGAGYVKSVSTVVGEILQEAHKVAGVIEAGEVTLRVNPEVAKVLKSNKNDYLQEIEQVLSRTVLVKSDPQMHQEKFDLN